MFKELEDEGIGGHAGTRRKGVLRALEVRDELLDGSAGRVGASRVAVGLKVFGIGLDEGRGEIERIRDRLVGLILKTAVDGKCCVFHLKSLGIL